MKVAAAVLRRRFAAAFSVLLFVASVDDTRADWLDQTVDRVLDGYDRESVLVVGELHGTEEAPALVHALARRLAEDGRVALALEISRQEQQRIDEFLRSDGGAGAVAALLAGDYWQTRPGRSDGRRSQAMLQLLDSIRASRSAGDAISVVALDDATFFDQGTDRRQGLAARIGELSEHPDYDGVVVLIGNYHARLIAPSRALSDGEVLTDPPVPTAARVDVPMTSVNIGACSGAYWGCMSSAGECGPVELPDWCAADAEYPIVTSLDPSRDAYHLDVTLERLTPSPPAR